MQKVISLLLAVVLIMLIPISACANGLSAAERLARAVEEKKNGNKPSTSDDSDKRDKEGYIYIWSEEDGLQYVRDDKYFELKNAVKKRIDDICYYDAEFSEIEVSVDASYEDNDHRIVSVHLKWDEPLDAKHMKKWSLECSDDLAAFLAEKYDYVTEIYVWWYSKHLEKEHETDKRYSDETKFRYTTDNGHAYYDFATGPLFDFKNYSSTDRYVDERFNK